MANGLCENCHKKPKSGAHRYCSRTCASQAAAAQKPAKSKPLPKTRVPPAALKPVRLCDYCGQNPTFGSFDHCSKSCAKAAATPPVVQPALQGQSAQKQGVRPPATAHIQPAKVSKPARQTLLQDQSSEDDDDYPNTDEEDEYETYPDTGTDTYPESDDDKEPVPVPPTRSAKVALKTSTPPRRVAGICLIPNCGNPSFVDRSGVKADYCSTKHREEAVTLGLVPECIMCQRYPQSGTDYFCSTACRNQSMTKT